MTSCTVARRYAKALFDLAVEEKGVDAVAADMRTLQAACEALPAIPRALADERIETPRRAAAALAIAKSLKIGAAAANLVRLMIVRGRITLLPIVAQAFAARVEQASRLTVACASVAEADVAPAIRQRLETILAEALGMSARCEVVVDAELVGGFAVQLGDVRYDASIKGKLERMQDDLLMR